MRDRKQLYVLLGVAAWVTLVVAFFLFEGAQGYGCHETAPLDLAYLLCNTYIYLGAWFMFFLFALPGLLLLGCILLWWFGKK
jgi:hypothetical protein